MKTRCQRADLDHCQQRQHLKKVMQVKLETYIDSKGVA